MATTSALKPYRSRNVGTNAVQIGGVACPASKTWNVNGLRACHLLTDGNDTIRFYILDKDGATQTQLTPATTVLPGQSFLVSGQEIKDMLADGESLWAVASRANAFDIHMYVLENS